MQTLHPDGFPPPSGELEGGRMQTLHPDGFSPPRGSWRGAVPMASLPLGGGGGGLRGFTEPLLWIQLVAEGSSSTWRRLGVAMAKVRYKNVEGSVFQ